VFGSVGFVSMGVKERAMSKNMWSVSISRDLSSVHFVERNT